METGIRFANILEKNDLICLLISLSWQQQKTEMTLGYDMLRV